MNGMTSKAQHEMDVFRSFVASARLPIDLSSVQSGTPPAADIQCATHDGTPCQFELAELLWEDPQGSIATLAHGLALSKRRSEEKATLLAEGRVEEANQIQTWGSFGTPPLASVLQVLQKKCAKHYETGGKPLSLLLYYARANPLDPFDHLATTYHDVVRTVLAGSQFTHVWLYHYCLAYTLDIVGMPSGAVIRAPLASLAAPETQRTVIGHLSISDGQLHLVLDASYDSAYARTIEALDRASEEYLRTREQSSDGA